MLVRPGFTTYIVFCSWKNTTVWVLKKKDINSSLDFCTLLISKWRSGHFRLKSRKILVRSLTHFAPVFFKMWHTGLVFYWLFFRNNSLGSVCKISKLFASPDFIAFPDWIHAQTGHWYYPCFSYRCIIKMGSFKV